MGWAQYILASVVFVGRLGWAQESGWKANQANATMCQWQEPRGSYSPAVGLVCPRGLIHRYYTDEGQLPLFAMLYTLMEDICTGSLAWQMELTVLQHKMVPLLVRSKSEYPTDCAQGTHLV